MQNIFYLITEHFDFIKYKVSTKTCIFTQFQVVLTSKFIGILLLYHPYSWYTMDSSYEDITIDCNSISEFGSKATLVTLYNLYSVIYNFYFSF